MAYTVKNVWGNVMAIKLGKGRRKTKEVAATDDVVSNFEVLPVADDSERRRLIAEAAYYRAQSRGFVGGSPEADWLEAEAEIVALLANNGLRT